MIFNPISFPQLALEKRTRPAFLVLIAALSLGILSGCGGAWQPDPRDRPQSPARSGIEGSGITGPNDSRPY
jgi:hypothetical protein